MIVRLERVALVHPIPDMGDRTIQGVGTPIDGEEWRMEADYHRGNIGDVSVYRNTNVNTKGVDANWKWYTGIPTANIKAYRLLSPEAVLSETSGNASSNGESKAQNPPARTQASGPAAK